MRAALSGGEDETAGLDRTRAQQHLPMGLAGRHGKRRGDRDQAGTGLGKVAIEAGKAQVVTDRHRQTAPRRVRQNRAIAGTVSIAMG